MFCAHSTNSFHKYAEPLVLLSLLSTYASHSVVFFLLFIRVKSSICFKSFLKFFPPKVGSKLFLFVSHKVSDAVPISPSFKPASRVRRLLVVDLVSW